MGESWQDGKLSKHSYAAVESIIPTYRIYLFTNSTYVMPTPELFLPHPFLNHRVIHPAKVPLNKCYNLQPQWLSERKLNNNNNQMMNSFIFFYANCNEQNVSKLVQWDCQKRFKHSRTFRNMWPWWGPVSEVWAKMQQLSDGNLII